MNVVQPACQARSFKETKVKYQSISLIICVLLTQNLCLMPLKAYLSEELPFIKYSSQPKITSNSTNYATYRKEVLTKMQMNYNRHTLPKEGFFIDEKRNIQITRQVVDVAPGNRPLSRSFSYGLPACMFYPLKVLDNVVAFGANQRNISEVNDVFWYRAFNIPTMYFALWIVPGDDVGTDAPLEHAYTIYVANFALETSNEWKFCKLLYRLLTCSYIFYILWKNYFAHVVWLKKELDTYGLTLKSVSDKISNFVIVVGDPTCLVLSDPIVSISFMFEIWLSIDTVAQAAITVSQASSMYSFFVSSFYLSRLLWFPYGGLRLLGYVLKRKNAENTFNSADPTIVAMTTAFIVGPFTYFQANTFLCEVYHYLSAITFPSEDEIPYVESTFSVIVGMATITIIPIAYGFLSCKDGNSKTEKTDKEVKQDIKTVEELSSTENNSFKNRFLLWFSGITNHPKELRSGGLIHKLFELDKSFKQIPTFDPRGSDCFVMCYCEDKLICRVRITCYHCIDFLKLKTTKDQPPAVHAIQESEVMLENIQLIPLPNRCRWIA